MLVREANGPVWHWSVPQGSISARFSWATHSWGNRHCCMLGHPNMQQCLWDVPAVWLAADRLTPASSSPPYHYQPSLSNQHVKHFPLPPKYLTQPCHTLEAYTSDLLPSTVCVYMFSNTSVGLCLSTSSAFGTVSVQRHRRLVTVSLLWIETLSPVTQLSAACPNGKPPN